MVSYRIIMVSFYYNCMDCCIFWILYLLFLLFIVLVSLTWSDAHLHRQLVTLMSGPVVESFDREFRILYAASLPVPDAWKTGKPASEPEIYNKLPPLQVNRNKIELPEFIPNPPPPPIDSPLDWEAMGVIQRFPDSPLSPVPDAAETQFYHRHHLDRHQGGWEPAYNDFNSRLVPGHQEEGK